MCRDSGRYPLCRTKEIVAADDSVSIEGVVEPFMKTNLAGKELGWAQLARGGRLLASLS